MSMIQALKGMFMPQSKMMSKTVTITKAADANKDLVALKASAADILANQNKAMLKSGKKAYVAPEMKTVELKESKMTATSGSIDEDIFGGGYEDEGGSYFD